jgi:hypothetical protein
VVSWIDRSRVANAFSALPTPEEIAKRLLAMRPPVALPERTNIGPVACGGIALRPRSHRDPDGTSDLHDHVRHATDHRLRTNLENSSDLGRLTANGRLLMI